MSSSEGDTIRVGALLDCSLLDCVEDCTSVSSNEDDTIRVIAAGMLVPRALWFYLGLRVQTVQCRALRVPDQGHSVGCFSGIVH